MMKKQYIAIIVLVAMVISFIPGVPGQAQTDINTVVNTANTEIANKFGQSNYYDINKVNRSVYNNYGVLVYGQPHSDPKNGEYRYLGTTPTGENFPNHRRDPDQTGTTYFDDKNWIANPWGDPQIQMIYNIEESDYDSYRADYIEHFKKGMSLYHPARYRYAANPKADTKAWNNFYHIIAPPTQHTYGLAWLWYRDNDGKLWYITVPLAPTVMVEPEKPLDTVNINYHDLDGAVVAPTENITPTSEGVQIYNAKTIEGYTLQGSSQYSINIQKTDTNHTLTFTYKKNESTSKFDTVTIYYKDKSNYDLIAPVENITPTTTGEQTYTAKTIEGYTLLSDSRQTVTIDKTGVNHEITFFYKKEIVIVPKEFDIVTINYRYYNSSTKSYVDILPTDTYKPTETGTVRYNYKSVSGYELQGKSYVEVDIKKEGNNHEYTFFYKKVIDIPAQYHAFIIDAYHRLQPHTYDISGEIYPLHEPMPFYNKLGQTVNINHVGSFDYVNDGSINANFETSRVDGKLKTDITNMYVTIDGKRVLYHWYRDQYIDTSPLGYALYVEVENDKLFSTEYHKKWFPLEDIERGIRPFVNGKYANGVCMHHKCYTHNDFTKPNNTDGGYITLGGSTLEFTRTGIIRYDETLYPPQDEEHPYPQTTEKLWKKYNPSIHGSKSDFYVSTLPLLEHSFLIDDGSSYIRSYKVTLIVFDQINKTYSYTQKTIKK